MLSTGKFQKGFESRQQSGLFWLFAHHDKRTRNTCVQVENPGMKIMFPPTGFQYLANDIQLEGKDNLSIFAHPSHPSGAPQLCFPALTGTFGAAGAPAVPRHRTSLSEVSSEALESQMERLKMHPRVQQSTLCLCGPCPS